MLQVEPISFLSHDSNNTYAQPILPLIFIGNLLIINHMPNNKKFRYTWSFIFPNILYMLSKFYFYIFYEMGLSYPTPYLFSSENFILQDK